MYILQSGKLISLGLDQHFHPMSCSTSRKTPSRSSFSLDVERSVVGLMVSAHLSEFMTFRTLDKNETMGDDLNCPSLKSHWILVTRCSIRVSNEHIHFVAGYEIACIEWKKPRDYISSSSSGRGTPSAYNQYGQMIKTVILFASVPLLVQLRISA